MKTTELRNSIKDKERATVLILAMKLVFLMLIPSSLVIKRQAFTPGKARGAHGSSFKKLNLIPILMQKQMWEAVCVGGSSRILTAVSVCY